MNTNVTIDELMQIIGCKETELFVARRELAVAKQLLEQITRGGANEAVNDPSAEEND